MNSAARLWLQKRKELNAQARDRLSEEDAVHARRLRRIAFPHSINSVHGSASGYASSTVTSCPTSSTSFLHALLKQSRELERKRREEQPQKETPLRHRSHWEGRDEEPEPAKGQLWSRERSESVVRKALALCVAEEGLHRSQLREEEFTARCSLWQGHTKGILLVAQKGTQTCWQSAPYFKKEDPLRQKDYGGPPIPSELPPYTPQVWNRDLKSLTF